MDKDILEAKFDMLMQVVSLSIQASKEMVDVLGSMRVAIRDLCESQCVTLGVMRELNDRIGELEERMKYGNPS